MNFLSHLPVEFKEIFLSRPLLKIRNLNMQSILIHRFHISESFLLKFVYNTKIILVMLLHNQEHMQSINMYVPSQGQAKQSLLSVFSKQVPSM